MAFLYFYACGKLWPGADGLVPALAGDLALVSDLKRAQESPACARRVGPAWQVVVPTTMQVLDVEDGAIKPLAGERDDP
jgi:hypothetical protein